MQVVDWLSKNLLHHQTLAGYIEPLMQMFKPAWRSMMFRAKVLSQKSIGQDVIALELTVPKRWPMHRAGQHIALTVELDGRLMTRTFTIASSPEIAKRLGYVRLVIKTSANGRFTSNLSNMKVGQWVNISAPSGDFILNKEASDVLMLAAGSGITPFIAMLESLPPKNNQNIQLLYYAKPGQHVLNDELEQLTRLRPNVTVRYLSRENDGDVARQLASYSNYDWMACGPGDFYKSIEEAAGKLKVELSSEHFLALPLVQDTEVSLPVSYQGTEILIKNSKTLLSQLIDAGADVTFGCGIGICHQCQCVKKSGVVRNIKTGQLSDAGQTLIQLCISQPVTALELEV
ncbi:flavin reductase family protein [Pleionea sp. CnH1-48]|uniref:flavin reductase family protein n=1 Tax=Pleionea sp. CnH1-48 TaxID=2954494 RepID=UPI002096CF6B|nr:iron-sulfur cluster-binding domain-containing protein [Pleionea sp. CnH1-48]MCO7223259.1 iron-sulfur cluster-binding domain-containing protein [Pleionea sp. CnH1-48]